MKKYFLLFCILFFSACGYKPVAALSQEVLGGSVFVDVSMSKSDPQNSVAIKDGIRKALISRLGRDLADKNSADTVIIASIKSITFTPLAFDAYGYVNGYKANVTLNYQVRFKDGSIAVLSGDGEHDFYITRKVAGTEFTDSVISNQERYDAIAMASKECFDELVAKLAMKGLKAKQNKAQSTNKGE